MAGRFAQDGLGLHVDSVGDQALAMRIDHHRLRLLVREGAAEDVVAFGWQLDGDDALQLALSRLRAAGIEVREIAGAEAAERGVERLWTFTGPKRLRFELFTRPLAGAGPLAMRASGFVTGTMGLGHFAISSTPAEAALAFFQVLFDARLSDTIEDKLNGVTLQAELSAAEPAPPLGGHCSHARHAHESAAHRHPPPQPAGLQPG